MSTELSQLRFLIVDDSEIVRRAIANDFLAFGVHCDFAADGGAAVELLGQNTYDLITMDMYMPRMNGLELINWMTAHGIPTPVIVVTTENNRAITVRCLQMGVAGYLAKPFKGEDLVAKVAEVLHKIGKEFKKKGSSE